MKKIAFILAVIIGLSAGARDFRFGADVGLDLSKASNTKGRTYPAYHVAFVGEYDFKSATDGLFLAAKIGLNAKSWSHDFKIAIQSAKRISHPHYIQMPVTIGYRLPLNDIASLRIEAGPYFSAGLFGNSKVNIYNGTAKPYNYSEENCFGKDGLYSRFDTGISAGIGFTLFGHWEIGLNANIQLNKFDSTENRSNRTFGLSTGFLF